MSVVVAAAGQPLDPGTRAWVAQATAYARFAGPDGNRTEIGERSGLGHARLVTGRSRAAQPITLDGHVWLSADVRLDDRAGVIAALGGSGQSAKPDADDAELVLLAYAAWGERLVDHLRGDFAFVLWDDARQMLLCACDQIGVAPLHYATVNEQLLVASSPEILLLHPEVPDRLDDGAIAEYLLTGQAASFGTTTFAAIRRLPAAHLLRWREGRFDLRRYWRTPEFEPLLRLRRPGDYVAYFSHLLELAVGDRIGDGALSVQLSGGMDSTALSAVARRLRAHAGTDPQMHAVTMVLGASSGDQEGTYARLVADALGIEHDVLDDSCRGPIDPLAEPELITPEPTAYQWSDLVYRSMCRAAEHARTCLSGLGGDPLLGSIPWYWLEWLRRGHGLRLAVAFADHARLFRGRPRPHLKATIRYFRQAAATPAPPIPDWMDEDLAARTNVSARLHLQARPAAWTWDRRALSRDPVWQIWLSWTHPVYTRLPMRVRHPFADLRLLDFAARVPPHPWLLQKRILREATDGLLPAEVRQRPKTLLVRGPRATATPEARQALAQLVRSTPDVARFIHADALIDAILVPKRDEWEDWRLARPIGLVYWLAHWTRPRA